MYMRVRISPLQKDSAGDDKMCLTLGNGQTQPVSLVQTCCGYHQNKIVRAITSIIIAAYDYSIFRSYCKHVILQPMSTSTIISTTCESIKTIPVHHSILFNYKLKNKKMNEQKRFE